MRTFWKVPVPFADRPVERFNPSQPHVRVKNASELEDALRDDTVRQILVTEPLGNVNLFGRRKLIQADTSRDPDPTIGAMKIRTEHELGVDDITLSGFKIFNPVHTMTPVASDNRLPQAEASQVGGARVPPGDWTGPHANKTGGLVTFVDCHTTGWLDGRDGTWRLSQPVVDPQTGQTITRAPMKMSLQTECGIMLRKIRCSSDVCQEHNDYPENLQAAYLKDVTYDATGGNGFQCVSRSRTDDDDDHGAYWFGNRFMRPAGLCDEPTVLDNVTYLDEEAWSREASCVTFANGFQQRVYLEGVKVTGSRGAFVCWPDLYKGVQLTTSTDKRSHTKTHHDEIHHKDRLFKGFWINNFVMDYADLDPRFHRPAFMFSAAEQIHLGKIEIKNNTKQDIVINAEGAQGFYCGKLYLHHERTARSLSFWSYVDGRHVQWPERMVRAALSKDGLDVGRRTMEILDALN